MDVLVAALTILVPLALCIFVYCKSLFTFYGSVTAFVLSEIIGFTSSFEWMVVFFIFPFIAFIATKWRFEDKRAMGLQEGRKGERGALNILGVGIIPTAVSILYCVDGTGSICLTCAYLSALAVSTADTVASELGPLARKTYMITTLKRIEPGPNGGVSAYGFATSTAAAVVFSLVSWVLIFRGFDYGVLDLRFLIVAVAGVFGNIMDSVFGAVLENPGYISKYVNNASTSLIGALAGFLLCLAL